MGTQAESFIDLTDRLGRQTGGLSFYPFISSRRGSSEPLAYLMVRGKAMAEKTPELLDVMRDILLTARLDDRNRFKQVQTIVALIVLAVFKTHAKHALKSQQVRHCMMVTGLDLRQACCWIVCKPSSCSKSMWNLTCLHSQSQNLHLSSQSCIKCNLAGICLCGFRTSGPAPVTEAR